MARQRIVIVGAGFAGFHAARTLCRLARGAADIVLINPTDYFLYLPLLPEVASGVLEPRRVTIPLADALPEAQLVLAEATGVDAGARVVHVADPEGNPGQVHYDRLVLSVGSVSKLLPIPGIAEYAHGFRSVPEAVHLRDHVIRQIELADASSDPDERAARCTFVVVGAGYTGTEVAAHGQLLAEDVLRRHPRLSGTKLRWLLADVAPRVLPGLDERLAATTDRVLRDRGVDVRTGTSVAEATREGVRLSDGSFVPTRTLAWCVGVRADPLVASTGLPLEHGRLVVDEYLTVPGHTEILACGDAAAVPDLTRPGELTAMTAQHAERQGRLAAHNIAASYGQGRAKPYRHRDLGFVVDLGGWESAANPLQVPLSGVAARAVTRGYHLYALPRNRARTVADWTFSAVGSRPSVHLGLVPGSAIPLDTAAPELAASR
jgi:NADH dehydrogenase